MLTQPRSSETWLQEARLPIYWGGGGSGRPLEAGIADRGIALEQKSAERTRWRLQEVTAMVPVKGRPEMGVNVEDAVAGGATGLAVLQMEG